jgi:hypothetical protein
MLIALLQFEAMDQKVAAQLSKLYEARRRRAMLLGFAEAPVALINTAIAATVSTAQRALLCCTPWPFFVVFVVAAVRRTSAAQCGLSLLALQTRMLCKCMGHGRAGLLTLLRLHGMNSWFQRCAMTLEVELHVGRSPP